MPKPYPKEFQKGPPGPESSPDDRIRGQAGSASGSFSFALLQKNVLNTKRWDTRGGHLIAIVTWIERTSHRRRRQDAVGRLTPVDYKALMTPLITEAA